MQRCYYFPLLCCYAAMRQVVMKGKCSDTAVVNSTFRPVSRQFFRPGAIPLRVHTQRSLRRRLFASSGAVLLCQHNRIRLLLYSRNEKSSKLTCKLTAIDSRIACPMVSVSSINWYKLTSRYTGSDRLTGQPGFKYLGGLAKSTTPCGYDCTCVHVGVLYRFGVADTAHSGLPWVGQISGPGSPFFS